MTVDWEIFGGHEVIERIGARSTVTIASVAAEVKLAAQKILGGGSGFVGLRQMEMSGAEVECSRQA